MTKEERVRAAVERTKPDRLPYSMWTHLPGIDLDPVALAAATYDFYREFDVDVIKIMSNGMYAVQDFGCEVDFSGIAAGGAAKIVTTPVRTAEDWSRIGSVGPDAPAMSRELRSLGLVLDKVKSEHVPVVFTVFSPLTTAYKLSDGAVLRHIDEGAGGAVHAALAAIAETTADLACRAVEMGAAGVFFASQLSAYGRCPEPIYREYGAPYDKKVLEASSGWCDILHAHGEDIMFDLLKDYPADVFNWHAGESLPGLREAAMGTGKCVMGGLKRMDITNCRKNEIHSEIFEAFRELHGIGHILSPGCVIRYPLNKEMLAYVKRARDEIESGFAG